MEKNIEMFRTNMLKQPLTYWLPLGAIVGPALFTLAWLVLGFLSPGYILFDTLIAPYSPVSQPISGLGLGPTGPFMNTAFVLGGFILLGGVIGIFHNINEMSSIARWSCIALFALSPIGMILCGLFTLESIMLHLVGFLLAVGSPVPGFLVAGLVLRGIPSWKQFSRWLFLGSILTAILVVLFFQMFSPTEAGNGVGIAGLIQRMLTIEIHSLIAALGWRSFRRS
jgi:hypothetical protein